MRSGEETGVESGIESRVESGGWRVEWRIKSANGLPRCAIHRIRQAHRRKPADPFRRIPLLVRLRHVQRSGGGSCRSSAAAATSACAGY